VAHIAVFGSGFEFWHDEMILKALFWRPLLRRPWRFLVTVVGVSAGVAAVVSTVASSRAAIAAFSEGVEEVAGRSRLEVVRSGGVPDLVLGWLRQISREAVMVPVVEEVALLLELGDGVRVLGVDLLVDGEVRPPLTGTSGAAAFFEQTLTGSGAILSAGLAGELGVAVGDRITVLARARPVELEVAAVFRAERLSGVWNRIVVVDVALAQEIFSKVGRLDRIELVPRAGVTLQQLRNALHGALPEGYVILEPSHRRRIADQMVASLRFNLVALSAISVLVGTVLVGTTLATSVVQRRYTIALLRSMGASARQIVSAVLVEAGLIGAVGGVIGIAAGFVGARLALASVRATVSSVVRGVPATGIRIDPWLAAAALAVAMVIALTAAVLPLSEAVGTPPLHGLRHRTPQRLSRRSLARSGAAIAVLAATVWALVRLPAWHGLPVAALTAALALMAVLLVAVAPLIEALSRFGGRTLSYSRRPALRLASAALAAGRRRAAWAAGSVGVAVALAVAIATLVTSFRSTVVDWTEAGMKADIWIRPLPVATGVGIGGLDPELVTVAGELFGPEAVDPFYTVPVEYRGRPVTLAAAAFDVIQLHGSVHFPGRSSAAVFAEAYQRHGAVVNEPFASRFKVRVGDTIYIPVSGGTMERQVVGVFRDYARSHGLVVIDRLDFLERFPGHAPQEVALFLGQDADLIEARDRLLEAVRGRFLVEALLNRQLKREVLAAFDRTFAITTALYLVAAAVAVVSVATVLLALVGERRRELGLLRAMGGSRAQVFAVVEAQAALLGLAAAACGIVTGLAVGVILVKVVNLQSFGWTLQLLLPWRSVAWSGMWVMLACLVAGVAPAITASRLQPAEVLREEE
jgi:putative ABC transport system permease protein